MSFKFEEFVQENFAPAYRFAFCLSLAHDRATRLVDTTFQEAEALRKDDAQAKVDRTWVLETLHRKWRACHPVLPAAEVDAGTNGEPLLSIENAGEMDCDAVLKVLHSMSPAHRLLLSLFYFERLGFNEIARILQMAPETALPRLARAKILFRQLLEERRRASDTQLVNSTPEQSG